jgi:hypothetical protein
MIINLTRVPSVRVVLNATDRALKLQASLIIQVSQSKVLVGPSSLETTHSYQAPHQSGR